jgi:hypothetical protein
MRIQIQIPDPLWSWVCTLAHVEHRPPRQQLEHLAYQAIREAATRWEGDTGQHPSTEGSDATS